ncbi:hypothetical protein R3I46_004818 [Salmonella enterica]|nr:hypothetical protein [Salmonella enterica]ELR0452926.1 hypothetical protein [Salmonella enterica]ELX5502933.1 hypothetical protein [Salmonella enterica]
MAKYDFNIPNHVKSELFQLVLKNSLLTYDSELLALFGKIDRLGFTDLMFFLNEKSHRAIDIKIDYELLMDLLNNYLRDQRFIDEILRHYPSYEQMSRWFGFNSRDTIKRYHRVGITPKRGRAKIIIPENSRYKSQKNKINREIENIRNELIQLIEKYQKKFSDEIHREAKVLLAIARELKLTLKDTEAQLKWFDLSF